MPASSTDRTLPALRWQVNHFWRCVREIRLFAGIDPHNPELAELRDEIDLLSEYAATQALKSACLRALEDFDRQFPELRRSVA